MEHDSFLTRRVVLSLGRNADIRNFLICSQKRFWLHLHLIVVDLLDQVRCLLLEDHRGDLSLLDRIDSELKRMFGVADLHWST